MTVTAEPKAGKEFEYFRMHDLQLIHGQGSCTLDLSSGAFTATCRFFFDHPNFGQFLQQLRVVHENFGVKLDLAHSMRNLTFAFEQLALDTWTRAGYCYRSLKSDLKKPLSEYCASLPFDESK
jgi:hypothetical protein